ncbi:MAG: hypothetical protein Q8N88_05010 [Nanoarchaeota archaeon]|nr:hypothetical protein [Nanoarchaeota archaeon]
MVNKTDLICGEIHKFANNLKKYFFPFNIDEIPKNGVYILFQKGERAHGGDRIVRIGTHNGRDQLPSRLLQHFMNENKDRSIFRKNIGRAILNKDNDPFLKDWEIDLTTKASKKKNKNIDLSRQKEVEKEVTKYIRENFFFVIVPVGDKDERLRAESKLISSVSLCKDCKPCSDWLGFYSSKEKIRKSGLWLVNELWKTPFNGKEFKNFIQKVY